MNKTNLPFFIGGYFLDRNQGYSVIELTENSMKIEYDDGTEEILNKERAEIKARIHKNIISEYSYYHPEASEEYFKTLGFLSNNGKFEAEIPKRSITNFLDNYEIHSGERVTPDTDGIIILGDVDKWGPELRIYFPNPNFNFYLGQNIEIRSGNVPELSRINNNNLWMRLIRIGFRLGKNHNIESIRGTIPPDQINNFEIGLSL